MNADEVMNKITRLEADILGRQSDAGGKRIDLQTEVKGRLSLENVDVGPIVDVLKSIAVSLDDLGKASQGSKAGDYGENLPILNSPSISM
jgi:hypothetical protein